MATKIDKVLAWLLRGHSITQIISIEKFNYYRLSDGIYKLRKRGYDIRTDLVQVSSTVRYARYYLVGA